MPGGRRVLAFHTDFDLPAARLVADPRRLLERAAVNQELAAVLSESGFMPEQSGFSAAHSALLQPFAGPPGSRWAMLPAASIRCRLRDC